MTEVGSWPSGIFAITLFVEDLDGREAVLRGGLRPAGGVRGRRLGRVQLREHDHQPAEDRGGAGTHRACRGGNREAGARLQFTIQVDDVDAMCAELTERGVELLNGPMDRPWGIRTASFRDPGGHIWEIAH